MLHSTTHLDTSGRQIRAIFNFVDPRQEGGVVDDANPLNTRLDQEAHEVSIHDLRGREGSASLERNGFAILRSVSACPDFRDEQALLAVYYPEIASLIQRLTGATLVKVYGHIVRGEQRDGANQRGPALMAHVDNDFNTTHQLAARLAPDDQRDALMRGRFMLINVWRPIKPVKRNPLAILDGASVRRANLHPVRLLASRAGVKDPHGLNMSHHPDQRWYYLSDMQPDELLAFRQIDAKSDAVQFSGHTSFADPTSAPDAPSRESIEVRTVSYLPW